MAYIGSSPTKVVSRQSANIFTYTATANQTAFTGSDANGNTLACTPSDIMVHMNGLRLEESDFTATTTTVTLGSGAAAGDEVTITAFVTFETADHYTKSTADARYEPIDSAYTKAEADTRYVNTTGDTMTGNLGIGTGSPSTQLHIVPPNNTTANKITQSFGSARADGSDVIAGGFDSEFVTRDGNVNTGAFIRVIDTSTNGSFPTTIRGGNIVFGTVDGTTSSSADAVERARFDHLGNFMVGTTSSFGTSGITLGANNVLYSAAASQNVANFQRYTSDGEIVRFGKGGTTVGSIGVVGSNNLYVHGDSIGLGIGDDNLYPTNSSGALNDNAVDVGDSSVRFDDVYATNGTIQTSDENEKQNIASLTSAEITAATAISKLFKTFKWKDKVAAKGDNARTHTGVIAQQVETAMSDAGLDAGNYAFFISTTWWEADETYTDDEGAEQTRTNTYDTQEEAPEGATERNRKGIRYPELLAFIGAATEQRLTSIESRLTALEGG